MPDLHTRNQKIIDAIIKKADRICPGSLALIGIYGSFATGDFHDKSDLDLLVLINDERGWQLACAFIQNDLEVGHDIYCTTWESLQQDSLYPHPNIAKLIDSKIIYCPEEKYRNRFAGLQKRAGDILSAPFSREDYVKAEKLLREAEHSYMAAMLAEDLSGLRAQAANVIYHIENGIAMLNKKYFRRGTKRIYQELTAMEQRPERLCQMIEAVLSADSAATLQKHLATLMRETILVFRQVEKASFSPLGPVTADAIRGTFEEMFSNWRNKMYEAARTDNRHLAFMSMAGLNGMLTDIGCDVAIDDYDVFGGYEPQDLVRTAMACDTVLKEYLEEYRKISLPVNQYPDIDAFAAQYQGTDN